MNGNRSSKVSQFSLLTLLLLIATAAIWLACYRAARDAEQTRRELLSLREVARELNVDNRDQFAAVRKHPTWHDEHRFEVWVPDRIDTDAAILLQLEDVDSQRFGDPTASAKLPSGRHEIELILTGDEDEGWEITVLLDGQMAIQKAMPSDWNAGRGYMGGSAVSTIVQDLDMPFVLERRRFMAPRQRGITRVPNTPGDGLLLWIGPQPVATDRVQSDSLP